MNTHTHTYCHNSVDHTICTILLHTVPSSPRAPPLKTVVAIVARKNLYVPLAPTPRPSLPYCVSLSLRYTQRQQMREHIVAWEAFAADLSRGDCSMTSLSEKARVMLPMGQMVSKEEYRLACAGTMADETVEETTIAGGQLVSTGMWTFSVETIVTTAAVAPKSGIRRRVSYPAAFFLAVDPSTNKVTEVRMYAQNIALLAARGYAMVPDDSFAPVIRPV